MQTGEPAELALLSAVVSANLETKDEWQLVLRLIEGMAQRDLFPDKVPNSEKALCLIEVPTPSDFLICHER